MAHTFKVLWSTRIHRHTRTRLHAHFHVDNILDRSNAIVIKFSGLPGRRPHSRGRQDPKISRPSNEVLVTTRGLLQCLPGPAQGHHTALRALFGVAPTLIVS